MSVFSDIDIKREILNGRIICRPLQLDHINSSSIDLTLGEYFWRCDANPRGVFNPYDEDEINRYFAGPFQAKPYASVYKKMQRQNLRWSWPPAAGSLDLDYNRAVHPFKGIPEDWPVIVLRPRERILAHSHEFVGIRNRGTTMLKARSSVGRIGLKVCDDAGWGDTGFINRWTWEMRNDNDEAVIVPVGERMAQLVFFDTGPVERPYAGKYQGDRSIDVLISAWSPRDMLPRTFNDDRSRPLPLDSETHDQAMAYLQAEREYAVR